MCLGYPVFCSAALGRDSELSPKISLAVIHGDSVALNKCCINASGLLIGSVSAQSVSSDFHPVSSSINKPRVFRVKIITTVTLIIRIVTWRDVLLQFY